MCKSELETEQNCSILTQTLMAIIAFLSGSPGLLNRGPGGPLFWMLAFSTASCHQRVWSPNWLNFLCLSYIIVQRPLLLVGVTIALIHNIHYIPRPDAPVIYIGAFPFLTAWPGRRSIYNTITPWRLPSLYLSVRCHIYPGTHTGCPWIYSCLSLFRFILWSVLGICWQNPRQRG